jgi:hypothetical protein
LKNWLGFDDESVARTGMIDGKGFGGRLKLEQMWNQGRPVDPKFLALAKFLFSYGYGIPGRMPVEGRTSKTLIFSMTHGYQPWDERVDPLRERAAAMIQAKAEREQLLALEEGQKTVIEAKAAPDEPEGEALESVVPPPESPETFGGGGRGR